MAVRTFKKVLAANRGEIAMRIFRACYDLGLQTVAMYSNEDTIQPLPHQGGRGLPDRREPEPRWAPIWTSPASSIWPRRRGVDAIHPGYGFLSENAEFARACEEAGITFIGPSSEVLDHDGRQAVPPRQIAMACGVPTIPGSTEPLKDADEALEEGRGASASPSFSRRPPAAAAAVCAGATLPEEVEHRTLIWSRAEAKKAFGNDDIFMEKFLVEPKHIEVQILGDKYGNVVHLLASGTAPSSAAIRRWWSSPPPSACPRRSVRPCMRTP